jgi:hypothetical protein
MNNEDGQRLTTIRRLNLLQGLPPQEADATLFNGALFDVATLESIQLPPYNFTHPLSDYTTPEIINFIQEYGILAGRLNKPKTHSIGVLDIPQTNNQFVTLTTREVNRAGFWCLVQRSIFLHRPQPLATVDFIAPSDAVAVANIPPPPDAWYRRPADLGQP